MYGSTLRAIGLVALAGTFAFQTQAESTRRDLTNETVKVWRVDRSGHPPFKRELVVMDVVDTARLQTAPVSESGSEMVTIRTVDRRGKPPYSRRSERLTVSDIAVLEEAGEMEKTVFRGRPPFDRRY